jgi:type II secretory pathway pseudopilin PulG
MTSRHHAGRGFSLVELAIVITISGFMLVGIVRLFETLRLEHALKTTRQRIEKIQKQLDAFADKNERFPCPLPPGSGLTAAEPETCIDPTLKPGERDVSKGIPPVTSLNLTPEEAQDGWGNMFTYAVSAGLTRPNSMRGVTPRAGVIGMVNGYGDNVLDTPESGRYVILSHGSSGAGGFTPQGLGIRCREGTLSAKNCHAQADFVTAAWSNRPGPFFFDNIVVGDGSRRQARLLEHLDYCGRLGKYYAPERFYADNAGCVTDDKVYGNCTIETSYMDHGVYDPFTGDWSELPQIGWWPAKRMLWPDPGVPISGNCTCQKGFETLSVGTWELPLHHPDPPLTARQSCKLGVTHELPAIANDLCDENPPALDLKEAEWGYDYVTTAAGKPWKLKGSEWKPDDGKNWQILPITALDPDTGELVKAKAAAHKTYVVRTRHIVWDKPLEERNHKLTLYTCIRK